MAPDGSPPAGAAAARTIAPTGMLRRVRAALPTGRSLPHEEWERRHRAILALLWTLSVGLTVFSVIGARWGPGHALLHGLAPLFFAVIALAPRLTPRAKSIAVSLGLLTCAATLVHATHGLTESHFLFFVVIAVLTLYEDWLPFVVAVGYVLLHHGVMGAIDHNAVYDHSGSPWKWAAIHAGFVGAAGAVNVIAWRLNEDVRAKQQEVEQELRRQREDMVTVTKVTAEISSDTDARASICEAATELTSVAMAGLWEPDGQRCLVNTATVGLDALRGQRIRLGDEPSGAAAAFLSRERHFVGDAIGDPNVSQRLVKVTGCRAALFEPVMRGDRCVGVLTALWAHPVEVESNHDASIIKLLANEAGVAIERSDLLARLKELAATDPLTGLANRRAWEDRLSAELGHADRSEAPLAVALLDLDRFKQVNDSRGHQAGDRVLRELAAAWPSVLRQADVLGRLGGDEFGLILPNCDLTGADTALERLRTASAVNWSAGVVVRQPGETLDELMKRADDALYSAKAAGGSRVAVE